MICRPDKLSPTILIPNLNNASPRLLFYQSIIWLLFYKLQPFSILSTAFVPCIYLKYIPVSKSVAYLYVDKTLLLAFNTKLGGRGKIYSHKLYEMLVSMCTRGVLFCVCGYLMSMKRINSFCDKAHLSSYYVIPPLRQNWLNLAIAHPI